MKYKKENSVDTKSPIKFFIILGIIVIIIFITFYINTKGSNKKTTIELNSNLSFEVNSDLYLMSLIKRIGNGELITDNYNIDTKKLGKQEISIKYLDDKNKKRDYKFTIDIVDTREPTIQFTKNLTTTVGKKIDLLKDVKVIDNSNEELKAEIIGDYDINKKGTYKLKYSATDSSGNKKEEDFTLEVKDISLKTSGYYVASYGNKNSMNYRYGSIKFYSGNKFDWVTCLNSKDYGAGVFYRGTYKINGSKLIFNVTKTLEMQGWVSYKKTLNYTIVDENTIKLDGYTYKWQSKPLKDASSHPKSL